MSSGKGGSVSTGSGGSSTGSGGSSTGSGGSSTDGGNPPDPSTIVCSPGIPATTQFRRILNTQYDATVKDLLGVTSVTAPEGTGVPSSVLYADENGPMVSDAWRIYNDVGAAIADQVMASSTLKTNFITCDPSASGCLMQTIQTFGRKAFRRPLTTDEVTRFMALGTGTPTGMPAEVAAATLYAFLVDPSFLYIEETNTTAAPAPASSGTLQLSSYEVAARLSYMIWGSTPDATLSTAADNNQLQTKAQILTQAQRMVAVKAKTAAQLSAFHDHWVQMDNSGQHWWHIDHDTTVFPLYSINDRSAYQGEMDSFFATVAQTGQYKDLFLSNIGFVNNQDRPDLRAQWLELRDQPDPGAAGCEPASRLHDPPRVPELVLALQRHVADSPPVPSSSSTWRGVNVPPPPPVRP